MSVDLTKASSFAQYTFDTLATAGAVAQRVADAANQAAARATEAVSQMTDGQIDMPAATREQQVREQFIQQFGDIAQDRDAFHALMRQVYGDSYDSDAAESLRQRALAGDFSWLPDVQFVSAETLGGANGAYNADDGVVYINENLSSAAAAATFVEEAGHHIDTLVNASDTVGDEGEMLRRLLAGEKLSNSDIAAIRAEYDKGTIVVNGREVQVEFWLDDLWEGVKEVGGAVVDAVVETIEEVGEAFVEAGETVVDTVATAGRGLYEATIGTVVTLFTEGPFRAADKFTQGIDRLLFQAPQRLTNGLINSTEKLLLAGTNLLGPAEDFAREVVTRGVDVFRTINNVGVGITRDIFRLNTEVLTDFAEDVWDSSVKLFQGDFAGAAREFGGAFLNAGVRILGGIVDMGARVAQGTVDIVGVVTTLQDPSRPLTAEEEAILREHYGDSLDYDMLRVSEDSLSTQLGMSSHAIGNTIYLANYDESNGLSASERELLVHEAGHVWQHQNGGGDYIHKAFFPMIGAYLDGVGGVGGINFDTIVADFDLHRGDAYDWRVGFDEGKAFHELNSEQQAMLIQEVERARRNDVNGDGLTADDFNPQLSPEQFEYVLDAIERFKNGDGAP